MRSLNAIHCNIFYSLLYIYRFVVVVANQFSGYFYSSVEHVYIVTMYIINPLIIDDFPIELINTCECVCYFNGSPGKFAVFID